MLTENGTFVSLNFASPEEAAEFFACYLRGKARSDAPAASATEAKQPTVKVTPTMVESKSETSTAAKPNGNAAAAPIERATVSQAAVKLAVKDKAKAVEILAGFGVKAVKDVPDDQLAAVHAALTAATP